MNKFRDIDIKWSDEWLVNEPIEAMSSDILGRKLVVQILNGEVPINTVGTKLTLAWTNSNKNSKGRDEFNLVDESQGIYELFFTENMLSNIENLRSNLLLEDRMGIVTSKTFYIDVIESD